MEPLPIVKKFVPSPDKVVAIAPMLDITNIWFRHLVRLLTKKATLYTEMIAGTAVCMAKYF